MINDDPPAHGIPLRAFRKVAINAGEANATFPISDKAKIPRIIHQTLPTKALPPAIIENIAALNPGWEFRPYDDEGIVYFSTRHYAPAFLDYYQRVGPRMRRQAPTCSNTC
jgi:mannosyltransferase OCH1-like enzyme